MAPCRCRAGFARGLEIQPPAIHLAPTLGNATEFLKKAGGRFCANASTNHGLHCVRIYVSTRSPEAARVGLMKLGGLYNNERVKAQTKTPFF